MEIDWDELLECFLDAGTNAQIYFDRDSGDVVLLGEKVDDEEEGIEQLRELLDDEPDRFVEIVPIEEADRLECLESLIAELKDRQMKDLAALLQPMCCQTTQASSSLRTIDRMLSNQPEEKRRWSQLQEKLAQDAIAAWLEENDIEADNLPPWKLKIFRARKKPKKA